jgi:hypothetical protein
VRLEDVDSETLGITEKVEKPGENFWVIRKSSTPNDGYVVNQR